eukprot:1633-Eustigmatos_ZCMA.PRE.1
MPSDWYRGYLDLPNFARARYRALCCPRAVLLAATGRRSRTHDLRAHDPADHLCQSPPTRRAFVSTLLAVQQSRHVHMASHLSPSASSRSRLPLALLVPRGR